MRIVRTIAELRQASAELLRSTDSPSFALVPTMGALHAGHAELASQAVAAESVVAASIFVNPLQFGDRLDLERYPRHLEADAELLEAVGVKIIFAPELEEMYPGGEPQVRINAGALGNVFEGASRPGHFDGALTVVAKLLHAAAPVIGEYRAYFGQKDAQQLALVRRMVRDLNFSVHIVGVPTVRAADGLALSSRNRFLSEEERQAAPVLFRALRMLSEQAARRQALDLEGAKALINSQPLVKLDYLEIVDPLSFAPLAENCRRTHFTTRALALLAAQIGQVRLIDNLPLSPAARDE